MTDLSVTGEVVVNSEQAESAFNRVGDKAQKMANEVATSAGKAGQAVDKIGDGAGQSAEKFTRAESRISASIKRATNELELLGKTASQRLEFNISDKGLDAAKFEPALQKLREIEAQAQQAQRAATGSLDKMGISAAQTAAALRGVPAQFTDIAVSLQGGQAPLTVFLQQGGQLKDMFGGAGNAARALGGYVLGLVNPLTIAAAVVGTLAFAYSQGAKEADAYRTALITTGNAAGTTSAQLKSYAQEISGVVGTQGKAAESLAALASTGKIGSESLRDAAKAAVEYERATGQAVGKTAEQFASLRNEPLAAVLKLNDGMNFLTDSTYKQIKSLEEQGKTAEAAGVAQRAFADTLSSRAGEMERNLGAVERGWIKVKDAAKSAWDSILNVGRASTSADQLSEVRKQIALRENQIANAGFATNEGGAAFGRPSLANTERLRAELSGLRAQEAALEGVAFASRTAAEEERKRGEAVKATAAFDKAGEKFLSDKAKMERELAAARNEGAAAGKSQAEIETRLKDIRESYAKKGGSTVAAENKELRDQVRVYSDLAGVSSTYYAELANYQKQRAAGKVTEEQYVKLVEKLIEKQPFAVSIAKEQADATKAQAKASEEAAKAHLKYIESFSKGANAAKQQADQLRTEEAAAVIAAGGYYSLAQSIELVNIARLEEQQQGLLGNEDAYLAVQKEIDARKELVTLIGAKESRKASEDAAKDAARDWERAAADINRSLTDALLRGFESGKDFAENLRDTLVNMFKTLVLRPIISAVLSPISGAISGALGGGSAGSGGAIGVIGTASNAYSLYNAGSQAYTLGSQYFGGTMSGANVLGTAWANGTGAGIDGLLATNGAYGTAGGTASSSIGSLGMGAVYAGIAALIANAFGVFGSRKEVGTGLQGTLGSGDLTSYSLMRESGTLFSGPDYDLLNPAELIKKYKDDLAKHLESTGGVGDSTSYAIEQQIKDLERVYGESIKNAKTQSDAIQKSYEALRTNVGNMADVLGLSSDAVRSFTMSLSEDLVGGNSSIADTGGQGFKLQGLTAEEISAKIQEALSTANNTLAEQVIGTWEAYTETLTSTTQSLIGTGENADYVFNTITETTSGMRYVASEYAREGEKAIDTLTRLATSLTSVNTVFDALGVTMLSASLSSGDFASSLIDKFGGSENFSTLTADFYDRFYTDEEKRANKQKALDKQFADLGIEKPKTQDEFRKLVTDSLEQAQQQDASGKIIKESITQGFTGMSMADLGNLSISNLDPALFGSGVEDPANAGKLNSFIADIQELAKEGLSSADFSKGVAGLVDLNAEVLGIGQDAGETAAALLGLSGSFADLTESADEAAARVAKEQSDARDAAYSGLERAIAAEKEALQSQIDIASDIADTMSGLFDLLKSNVRDLYGEVDSTRAMLASQGNDFITQALATARTTGYLPDQTQLSDAISAARGGLDSGAYTSQFAADRDRLVLAGKLSQLEGLTGQQLTSAERTVKELEDQTEQLDKTLDYWKEQIEIANGTYEATLSVTDAIKNLEKLMFPEKGATKPEKVNPGSSGDGFVVGGGGGGGGDGASPATNPWLIGIGIFPNEPATSSGSGDGFVVGGGIGVGESVSPEENEWLRGLGIRSFDVGTNYVPRDMLAQIHEGEMIVPKAYNPAANPGMSGGNGELVAEVRALREEVAALRSAGEKTASNTALMPQMARQMDTYTNGGQFSRQKALA